MGSVVHGIGDELGDSTLARDIVARMGGTSALEEAFVAVAFAMMGMVAAALPSRSPCGYTRKNPASAPRPPWPVPSRALVGWPAI
jgi:hypothetical protein